MAKVAADLQNIAATLAEAQRSGHVSISGLDSRLVQLDNTIAAEIAQAKADGVNLDWSALKTAAIDATKQSLTEMTAVRDAYGAKLDEAELGIAWRFTSHVKIGDRIYAVMHDNGGLTRRRR